MLFDVVEDALQPGDMTDRPQRRSAELAHTLGDHVRHGVDLGRLFVQQEVIVTEVRA